MMDFGSKLKNLRIKKNLTQRELADKMYVSDKTISSWESNRTMPDINIIFELSNALETNFYSLLYDDYCNDTGIETEVKLKVDEKEYNRILYLVKRKAKYIGEEKQSATYYVPTYRDFNNEYLRVRSENGKWVLNYKKKKDKMSSVEYETLIDNVSNMENILEALDMKKLGVINKIRNKYLYDDKYEFSFDDVDEIGLFVEVEIINHKGEVNEYNKMMEVLLNLNIDLNLIDNKHYPDYLLEGVK